MNEQQFTLKLKKAFEENRFEYIKLADLATQGLPDIFVAKNKKGIFFEIKFFEVKKFPTEFTQWSRLGKGVQLARLCRLATEFNAWYLFAYKEIGKNGTRVCMVNPHTIQDALNMQLKSIPLPLPMPIDAWMELLLSSYSL